MPLHLPPCRVALPAIQLSGRNHHDLEMLRDQHERLEPRTDFQQSRRFKYTIKRILSSSHPSHLGQLYASVPHISYGQPEDSLCRSFPCFSATSDSQHLSTPYLPPLGLFCVLPSSITRRTRREVGHASCPLAIFSRQAPISAGAEMHDETTAEL